MDNLVREVRQSDLKIISIDLNLVSQWRKKTEIEIPLCLLSLSQFIES